MELGRLERTEEEELDLDPASFHGGQRSRTFPRERMVEAILLEAVTLCKTVAGDHRTGGGVAQLRLQPGKARGE